MKTETATNNGKSNLKRPSPEAGMIESFSHASGVSPVTLRRMFKSATWDTASDSYKRVAKSLGMTPEQMTAKWKDSDAGEGHEPQARFPRQLQEGEPLPILELLERLHRLSCDVVSMADGDETPRITIGGAILETDQTDWKPICKKLRKCEVLLADLINCGISQRTAEEWGGRGPAVPIFKAEASRSADPLTGGEA